MNDLNEVNENKSIPGSENSLEDESDPKNIENITENQLDINERTLKAAENGDLLALKKCLKLCPNCVRAVDSDLYTPLHRSTYNNHIEAMRLLIDSGAHISAQTIDGWTPLHCAAKWGHIEAMDLLLNCGAPINAVSNGANTALHLAANLNNRPLLELLLHNEDIDIDVKNESGETAYQIAKRSSSLYQLWHYL